MFQLTLAVCMLAAPVPKNDAVNSKATLAVLAELGLGDTFGKLSDVPGDYRITAEELKAVRENPEEHPLRAVIVKAGERIEKANTLKVPMEFTITDFKSTKMAFRGYQKDLANRCIELEEALDELQALNKLAVVEKHPRWKAHHDFLLGYLPIELAKAQEFNLMLARFITDSPNDGRPEAGQDRFKIVAVETMKSRKQFRDMAKSGKEQLSAVANSYRITPWGDLAGLMANEKCGLSFEMVKAGK